MLKTVFKIGLSLGVSFTILALLLQMLTTGLSDGDRPTIFSVLQATSVNFVIGFLSLYVVSLFVRAYRYRLLISVTGESNVPSFPQMILVTGIRNMVVDMLPARLGELSYVGLLNRGYGVKLQHCISSLSLSVALDFIALLVVVIFVVVKQSFGDGPSGWAIGALLVSTGLSVVAASGLFVVTPWLAKSISTWKPHWLTEGGWRTSLLALLNELNQSLQSVLLSGKATMVIFVSVWIRILKYTGFYLLFRAVVANSFPFLAELPVEHVVSALIGGEIGASLPIPTFMSFGVYEAGSSLVFQLLGVGDQVETFITMLCVHIWSQSIEYLFGGILIVMFLFLNREPGVVARGDTFASKDATASNVSIFRPSIMFVSASVAVFFATFFLAYQLWMTSKLGSLNAPSAGGVDKDIGAWKALSQTHVSRLDGFVVFSSNRDGNHDIFRRDLKTFKLDKLTNHPNTETYPRISPNGKRLVFSRAHQQWVSQRNTVAWDIYVLDLETLDARKVGQGGTAPAWLNNSEITYLRASDIVERVDVDTLESEVLYQSGQNNMMPAGAALQNPKYNPASKQLAFTARQSAIGSDTGYWGTAINTNGEHQPVLNGCELSWNFDGSELFQVSPDGPDGSVQIVTVGGKSLSPITLINLDGEFTHEYWPKDSSNGEYMVFGASRGASEHEHDTQDYEVFLWAVGSDPSKATRMTFHTGNDNWPDVYIR